MEQTYLYSVRPRKPIKDIEGVPFIRSPRSLQLTKEDVIKCLDKASVYRYFANEGKQEKVTIDTVDRLHNAKFMTEEEYKDFLAGELGKNSGKIVENNTDNNINNNKEPEKMVEEVIEDVSEVETEVTEDSKVDSAVDNIGETVEEAAEEAVIPAKNEECNTVHESIDDNDGEVIEENKGKKDSSKANFKNNNHHKNNKR